MAKVVWLPAGPNKNLYSPLYEEVGKKEQDLELFMIVPEAHRYMGVKSNYFRIRYLPTKEYKGLIFFPVMIFNWLRGLSNHDVTSTMRIIGLGKELKSIRPDLVISNLEYHVYTWQAAYYCWRNKVPFILQTETQRVDSKYHKMAYKAFKLIFRRLLFEQPTHILAWTRDGYNFAKSNFPADKDKIRLLPVPVDINVFRKVKVAKPRKFTILMNARFVPYKRHNDFLQALRILKNKGVKFQACLLGSGPYENQVRSQVIELGLTQQVKFIERVQFEQLRYVYSASDCIVLPSYNDAIGTVVPEAMACGIPVVVSDTAGAATYVRNGYNGYTFRTYDIDDLAKKIMLVMRNNQLGKQAQKTILERYTVKQIASDFNTIIREALQKSL